MIAGCSSSVIEVPIDRWDYEDVEEKSADKESRKLAMFLAGLVS